MALLTREMLPLPDQQPQESPSDQLYAIPDGKAGIAVTLDMMVDLTKEFRRNLTVRKIAESIIESVPGKHWYAEAQAIQEWVRDHIRYTQDVYDVEMVKTPLQTYISHMGDCDDMSLLAGTLLQSIGHPVRYVAVATDDAGNFNHVYVETRINDDWVGVETTEPVALGWTPQPQLSRMVRHV